MCYRQGLGSTHESAAHCTFWDKAWCRDKLVKRVRKALEPLSGIMALRDTKTIHTAQQLAQVLLRFCSNTTLTFFLRTMPPSVTQDAAREHDRLMEEALYTLVGGARVGRNSPRWRVAVQQARLPVRMGGMGLTSAMDIREAAWVGTWALVTRPIRELHEPFRDLDVALAPGERFDELREAHKRLRALRDEVGKTWREWDGRTLYQDVVGPFKETKAVGRRRYHPPKLTPAAEVSLFRSSRLPASSYSRRSGGTPSAYTIATGSPSPTPSSARHPGGAAATRLAGARTTSAGARRFGSSQSARRGLAPS